MDVFPATNRMGVPKMTNLTRQRVMIYTRYSCGMVVDAFHVPRNVRFTNRVSKKAEMSKVGDWCAENTPCLTICGTPDSRKFVFYRTENGVFGLTPAYRSSPVMIPSDVHHGTVVLEAVADGKFWEEREEREEDEEDE